MTDKKIVLYDNEEVLAVVPEHCSGPGWTNTPVWVYIVNDLTGAVRTESIQPERQTAAMLTLFDTAVAIQKALKNAVPVSLLMKK